MASKVEATSSTPKLEPFNDPKGDTTLQSRDGVIFRVSKVHLSFASKTFSQMFDKPAEDIEVKPSEQSGKGKRKRRRSRKKTVKKDPDQTITDSRAGQLKEEQSEAPDPPSPHIPIDYLPSTVDTILNLVYATAEITEITNLFHLYSCLIFAQEYEMDKVMKFLRQFFQPHVSLSPHEAFLISKRFGWDEEASLARENAMFIDISSKELGGLARSQAVHDVELLKGFRNTQRTFRGNGSFSARWVSLTWDPHPRCRLPLVFLFEGR